MAIRTNIITYKGTIKNRSDSKDLLANAGDFVIAKRRIRRLLILRCPCGCGDDLLINLDKRAGPAWRLYSKSKKYSLYPSYWRDSKCGSHFIIWNNIVYWCYSEDESDKEWSVREAMEKKVLDQLEETFTHYIELADKCGLIPWECLQACRQLSDKGLCVADHDRPEGFYKRM